ncbi:PQQ-dependent sugar dehydrogenase [Martelella sp. HB161492]|uniref:PQQ-dependent sugar dehydrogenase n=1 Tax=Martelella sp. HB161492 TaxID=2720726 RepID=UPI00159118A4|nr:PQQ-dependent sugar dehydrogenase [Martelella sp. HB161492]
MKPGITTVFTVLVLATGCASAKDFNAAPPNAPDQHPAFAGQTRAPVLDQGVALNRKVIAKGLNSPWGMDQLPDGRYLVTERPGNLVIVGIDGAVSRPVSGMPAVAYGGQGGLLDVVVRDDFDATRRVWWSYAEPRAGGRNATAVATGTLSADDTAMENVAVIFRQQPAWNSSAHFGSRLVFDRDGMLFVTTGERSLAAPRQLAQDISTDLGKVIRIAPDGGAAPGNPAMPGGRPEIWSYGHRNLQSAALGPNGRLWTVEHGPRGGDELNHPEAGRNYGWPVITYGINYNGQPIGEGLTQQNGMEQPVYYWDPVIAPSGMAFYDGDVFPDWRGSVLIGGLAGQALVRLTLDGDRVTGEARYLQGMARIRDVDVARDGTVMVLSDGAGGAMIQLTP